MLPGSKKCIQGAVGVCSCGVRLAMGAGTVFSTSVSKCSVKNLSEAAITSSLCFRRLRVLYLSGEPVRGFSHFREMGWCMLIRFTVGHACYH